MIPWDHLPIVLLKQWNKKKHPKMKLKCLRKKKRLSDKHALKLLDIIKRFYELIKQEDTSEIEYVIKEMKYIIATLEESIKSKENKLEEKFVVYKFYVPS